jgi:hypothetical protein
VRTPTEGWRPGRHDRRSRAHRLRTTWLLGVSFALVGCSEPSARELKNRRELEALLTAITLKDKKELDKDTRRIEERHVSGELSDESYKDLQDIIKKAEGGDWGGAERQAYQLRESKPFFK